MDSALPVAVTHVNGVLHTHLRTSRQDCGSGASGCGDLPSSIRLTALLKALRACSVSRTWPISSCWNS